MSAAENLIHFAVTLFIVVDPIGIAVIFAAMTRDCVAATRRRMAAKAVVLAAFILLAFYLSGEGLLRLLGVSESAFRIAGGVLLFLLSLEMIFVRQSGLRTTTERETHEAQTRDDLSVFPLAFPLIAGPGAITTILLATPLETLSIHAMGVLVTLLLVLASTLAALLAAPSILKMLGETGANVISRVLGLILTGMAVQFVLDGVAGWWKAIV